MVVASELARFNAATTRESWKGYGWLQIVIDHVPLQRSHDS